MERGERGGVGNEVERGRERKPGEMRDGERGVVVGK